MRFPGLQRATQIYSHVVVYIWTSALGIPIKSSSFPAAILDLWRSYASWFRTCIYHLLPLEPSKSYMPHSNVWVPFSPPWRSWRTSSTTPSTPIKQTSSLALTTWRSTACSAAGACLRFSCRTDARVPPTLRGTTWRWLWRGRLPTFSTLTQVNNGGMQWYATSRRFDCFAFKVLLHSPGSHYELRGNAAKDTRTEWMIFLSLQCVSANWLITALTYPSADANLVFVSIFTHTRHVLS